jgi:hypothetical protein
MSIEQVRRFVGRTDVFSIQLPSGIYVPVKREITDKDLEEHLSGKTTIGCYVINQSGLARFGVIDIDKSPEEVDFAIRLGESIMLLFPDFDRVLETSGRRGCHIWVFMKQDETPRFIRNLIKTRLKLGGFSDKIEVFPKQDRITEGGFGNLVKLPLGKHKLGGWSKIIKEEAALSPVQKEVPK